MAGFNSTTGIYSSPRPPLSFPSEPNLSMVSFLFRHLRLFSDRPSLVDASSGDVITFRQLHSLVYSFAAGLSDVGVNKGDVILILAPNSTLYPVAFLSVIALGAVPTTVNPLYTRGEISKQLKDSGAKMVITVDDLLDKVSTFGLPIIFLSKKNGKKLNLFTSNVSFFEDLAKTDPNKFSAPEVNQDDTAALLYSSGTTGASKGVILTHRNFIATALMAAMDQDLRGEGPNTFLCFLPMFHIFGLASITYAQLVRGNCIVVMSGFEMEMTLKSIERFRVNYFFVVPPVIIALAKSNKVKDYDVSSLRWLGSGAAPLGKDVMEEVSRVFPLAHIVQGYGLTESCAAASLEFPNGKNLKFGSTGHLMSGIEAKVVGVETHISLPPNELGELLFRGPNIMQGYFNNPEATKLTLDEEGWLHTGDLGYFDDDGQLFVVDRIKELIKCKGFQVAPAELEGLLLAHSDISDAAVVPFPDTDAGEVPIAYVVRSANSSLTEVDVQRFIESQVAPFKRLRRVTFVESIPRSTAGKILRRELIQKMRSNL